MPCAPAAGQATQRASKGQALPLLRLLLTGPTRGRDIKVDVSFGGRRPVPSKLPPQQPAAQRCPASTGQRRSSLAAPATAAIALALASNNSGATLCYRDNSLQAYPHPAMTSQQPVPAWLRPATTAGPLPSCDITPAIPRRCRHGSQCQTGIAQQWQRGNPLTLEPPRGHSSVAISPCRCCRHHSRLAAAAPSIQQQDPVCHSQLRVAGRVSMPFSWSRKGEAIH